MVSVQPVSVKGIDHPVMVMTIQQEQGVYYVSKDQLYVVMPGIGSNLIKLPLTATIRDLVAQLNQQHLLVNEIMWGQKDKSSRPITQLDNLLQHLNGGISLTCTPHDEKSGEPTYYHLANRAYKDRPFFLGMKMLEQKPSQVKFTPIYYTNRDDLSELVSTLTWKTPRDTMYTILRSVIWILQANSKATEIVASLQSLMVDVAVTKAWHSLERKYNLVKWIPSIQNWLKLTD